MDFNDSNLVFTIIAPIVIIIFLTVFFVGCCTIFQRVCKKRDEHVQTQVQAVDPPSVYVIPISLSEDELHRPPRYSTVQFYEPPPAYHELNLKPEACPVEAPPAYSESVSPSPSHSWS